VEAPLGRTSIQGTGTNFPALERVAVLEVELVVEFAPVLSVLEVLAAPELEFKESTAKSIRPDVGLIMTALIVPRSWPWLSLTWAPIILLARTS